MIVAFLIFTLAILLCTCQQNHIYAHCTHVVYFQVFVCECLGISVLKRTIQRTLCLNNNALFFTSCWKDQHCIFFPFSNILYVWWYSVWFMYIFSPCQQSQLSSINFYGQIYTHHTHTHTFAPVTFLVCGAHFRRGTIANMHKSHLRTQTKNPVRNYRIPFFYRIFFSSSGNHHIFPWCCNFFATLFVIHLLFFLSSLLLHWIGIYILYTVGANMHKF